MKRYALFIAFAFVFVAGSARCEVPIDDVHFPDEGFRSYVLHAFDWDGNGILSDYEISQAKNVTLNNYSNTVYYVESLIGIEYLTALETLQCDYSGLVTLDVSKNTALKYLSCSYNFLTSLNVSGCTELLTLNCNNNQLTALDLDSNKALNRLSCNCNYITRLDLRQNTALTNCSLDRVNMNGFADILRANAISSFWYTAALPGLVINSFVDPNITDMNLYQVNFNRYMPGSSGIYFLDEDNNDLHMGTRYSRFENGILIFDDVYNNISKVISVTAYANDNDMLSRYYIFMGQPPNPSFFQSPIPVTPNIKTEVIEGKLNTDKIICGFDAEHYLNSKGEALTENNIADYSYSEYGKLGFAADGNSRLILRVKSDKTGYAVFSFNGQTGAKIEKLTDRKIMSNIGNVYNDYYRVETEKISEGSLSGFSGSCCS